MLCISLLISGVIRNSIVLELINVQKLKVQFFSVDLMVMLFLLLIMLVKMFDRLLLMLVDRNQLFMLKLIRCIGVSLVIIDRLIGDRYSLFMDWMMQIMNSVQNGILLFIIIVDSVSISSVKVVLLNSRFRLNLCGIDGLVWFSLIQIQVMIGVRVMMVIELIDWNYVVGKVQLFRLWLMMLLVRKVKELLVCLKNIQNIMLKMKMISIVIMWLCWILFLWMFLISSSMFSVMNIMLRIQVSVVVLVESRKQVIGMVMIELISIMMMWLNFLVFVGGVLMFFRLVWLMQNYVRLISMLMFDVMKIILQDGIVWVLKIVLVRYWVSMGVIIVLMLMFMQKMVKFELWCLFFRL